MARRKKNKIFNSVDDWGQHSKGTFTTSMDVGLNGKERTPWYRKKKKGSTRKHKKLSSLF